MRHLIITLVGLSLFSCRPDPGPHFYESQENFSQSDQAGGNLLGGTVPFEDGIPRLEVGVFYEGDATDRVAINETDTFYYIYDQVLADESRKTTFTQTSDSDCIEGTQSDYFLMNDLGWFGCGVHWNDARDLSEWTHLSISFKSDAASITDIRIGMNNVVDDNEISAFLSAAAYGYVNNGLWHRVVVPLSGFVTQGIDLSAIRSPLILSSGTLSIDAGDVLLVDDAYFFIDNEAVNSSAQTDGGL